MIIDKIDIQMERYLINRFVSMPKLFDSLDIDYRIDGNMYCPFHHNENTPSAHLYSDDTGYRLWCFSESRMYGAWNVYKTYIPQIDTTKLAIMIFNRFPEPMQKKLLNDLGTEQELDSLPYKESLKDFKRHKINITELLQIISDSYKNEA